MLEILDAQGSAVARERVVGQRRAPGAVGQGEERRPRRAKAEKNQARQEEAERGPS